MERYKKVFKEKDDPEIMDQIINSINLKPVENEIKTHLGSHIPLKIQIEKHGFLSMYSDDIVKLTGIFQHTLKTCVLKTFNSSIDSKTTTWWSTLSFQYEDKTQGSNGMKVLTCFYNYETKKWKFEV